MPSAPFAGFQFDRPVRKPRGLFGNGLRMSVGAVEPPPGFHLDQPTAAKPASPDAAIPVAKPAASPAPPPGFDIDHPTGEVVDGDTLRLPGANARLYGVDAFETGQEGLKADGLVPIGLQSKQAFDALVTPQSKLYDTGERTWNRPVVQVSNDGIDAGRSMLEQGWGLATPEFLRSNPDTFRDYMETERLARQNRRGAHATDFNSPKQFRDGDKLPDAPHQMVARGGWDPTPFQGLKPDIEAGYLAIATDPKSTADDLMAYADRNAFQIDRATAVKFIRDRNKGARVSGQVTYDKSLTNPAPPPLTDSGDGAGGAAARGLGDTVLLSQLDELGGVVDSVGLTPGRENVWTSDRRWGDILHNNTIQNRSILRFDEAEHPYARTAGQIAGGFVVPYGAGVRTATGLAKLGAVEGGAYAYGAAEGDFAQRLPEVPLGVATGLVGGFALGKAGEVVGPRLKGFFANRGRSETAMQSGTVRAPIAAAEQSPPPPGFVVDRSAAMAASDDVLTAPMRQRDYIDVNAAQRPRGLLDDATPAQMEAAAARISPSDMLPAQPNTVGSMEESASIGEGMRPSLDVVDERSALGTRHFPSTRDGSRSIPRKGPVDLVSFVRSQGGLRNQGGELSRYDNAVRELPFAQAENRLGKFIDNGSGANLDDMAERAWDAGYFPDHSERPSIDEFLDALDETHAGSNRRFLPDDFEEVDRFNGLRQQNDAVERANASGDTLASDLGQPVGIEDLAANTPPLSAYDDAIPSEWISRADNINLDKLESPQDIRRALDSTSRAVGGFDAARRGEISQGETQRLASELGMTADDLLTRRKGEAFNAEQAVAARRILARSGNEMVNLARRVMRSDNPGDEELAAFRQAWTRHVAIQEQVSGMTAEAGRALQSFRALADSRDAPANVLRGMVGSAGGPTRIRDAAEMIVDLAEDPGKLNRFAVEASKPKWKDRLVELWYNFLLSGPQTHVVNMTSNTLTALAQIPEHAVAAGIGGARRAFNIGDTDRVLASEVGQRSFGLLQGIREGLREGVRTFRTGDPADAVTKVEELAQKAIPGRLGEAIRIPTRALGAEDELFKAIGRRMEINGLAARMAHQEGKKGQAAAERIAELTANPTDEMIAKAFDYARYITFTRPLGPTASKVSQITTEVPALKLILPFVRTPTNLIKFSLERSPLAPVLKEWRKEVSAGGARRDLALARATVGSGVGAMVANLAQQGLVTGGPPSDRNKGGLMRANGWQPYSIKIGDRYYSYLRLDPFASTLGVAADLATAEEGMTDNEREHGAALLTVSIIKNLASKTWLSGITDAITAMEDPERYGGSFIKRLAGSAAVPTGVAQVSRTIDPTFRDSTDSSEYIQSRIPGMSSKLDPRRDVWGRPIVGEGGLGPDLISPIWQSTARNDPITTEALRVGASVSPPRKQDVAPENWQAYQEQTGALARRWLGDLIRSPQYQALEEIDKAEEIRDLMADARRAVRKNLGDGEPVPARRELPMHDDEPDIPPPPPGFTAKRKRRSRSKANDAPPPPPGFVLN